MRVQSPVGRSSGRTSSAAHNRDVAAVQRYYPQIYLACHTRHQRRRSNSAQLTTQESSLLAHLSERHPMRAAALARHLGVVPSTMSAAIKRLVGLGYIARNRDDVDGRAASLRLSRAGARATYARKELERRMRIAAWLVLALVVLAAGVAAIGWALPQAHVASRSGPELSRVEMLPGEAGRVRFRERPRSRRQRRPAPSGR